MKRLKNLLSSPLRAFSGRTITIPSALNMVVAMSAYALAIYFLWAASNYSGWYLKVLFALGFGLVGNTIFSLLHESVHRIFHHEKYVNDFFGQLSAIFFPTGFHFQRAFHLGHHRRNRTDVELFEQYAPGDSKLLKFTQLYTVLLGFYWTSAPLGGLLYILSPSTLKGSLFRSQHPWMKAMSMDAMLSGLDKASAPRIRLELIATLLFQIALFLILDLSFLSWLLCYWSFAIIWGSLQYADHAWSVRDIRQGAWNLKVNTFIHWVFLHYHHHLAHHQHPYVPWIHLHRFVDSDKEKPSHFSIWLKMWKGPTPVQQASPLKLENDFEKALYFGLND